MVGKWHLGLGDGKIDWNAQVKPGPMEIGFDESFIVPATPDRGPCVYLQGHEGVRLDSADPLRVSYKGPIGDEPPGMPIIGPTAPQFNNAPMPKAEPLRVGR